MVAIGIDFGSTNSAIAFAKVSVCAAYTFSYK